MCARFQADPKEAHLTAEKQILRYLVHTPKFGLWYSRGSTFDLIGYSDADWAGCNIDRKSTSGTCQFLGRSLVSSLGLQRSKILWLFLPPKPSILPQAIVAAIVLDEANPQGLWLQINQSSSSM